MSVPPEVRVHYVAIVDSILADADLTTISVKQVRNGIQEKVQYDITPHKVGCLVVISLRLLTYSSDCDQ